MAGPLREHRAPLGGDAASQDALKPWLGAALPRVFVAASGREARWKLASSSQGTINLKAAFGRVPSNVIGYAAGIVHVERAVRALLLLGVDDGVRVLLDGREVYARDEARPLRDDDDVVPLDLTAGDHVLLLALAQRDGAWAFRARLVDDTLAPIPDVSFELPGTTDKDARELSAAMASARLSRRFDGGVEPAMYRPRVVVSYDGGAPRGVPLAVHARLGPKAQGAPTFDLSAGAVPVTPEGTRELDITLPPIVRPNQALSLDVVVAGRTFSFPLTPRPRAEQAISRAVRALAKVAPDAPWLAPGSLDSVRFSTERLTDLVSRGDGDAAAQDAEARELEALASNLERDVDPYEGRTGIMRRALRSRIDGALSEYGLYVPPRFPANRGRKVPLVIALHGFNGRAMGMMHWVFGGDDPKRGHAWLDRHIDKVPDLDAFVIAPLARGNSFYREIGEVDVMDLVAWATSTFPIDPARITITGASMGGTGAASIPLHFPSIFAAAEPLCGYHSYQIRQDVRSHRHRPWETFLIEDRSNALWAPNGERLPLWIVHGTRDLPERNSGVLIEAYEKLGLSVKHDHPDLGHNVWQPTYAGLRGLTWLLGHRLDLHPAHVHFKTSRTRWRSSAWLGVDELAREAAFGEVDARVTPKTERDDARVAVTTRNVGGLTFTRDEVLVGEGPVSVRIDGQDLTFAEGEPLSVHRDGDLGTWRSGPAVHTGPFKRGAVTGPLRDAFYEPLLFVYGASPDQARENELVARAFANIHAGVEVSYPILSDAEFFARGEALANDRALFLVGRNNGVRDALEQRAPGAFPIHVDRGGVTIGAERITGSEIGAAFIHPNPLRPDRYVVVMAGADAAGTLRARSLPDLLPDFVVWDAQLAPSRGHVVLGPGAVRAGGYFTNAWKLPVCTEDPFARAATPQGGACSGSPAP